MPRFRADDRTELLARVASLYYELDIPQEEIARRIGMTRSNVSRLLKEARARRIVEFRIAHPLKTSPLLEEKFRMAFGLKYVEILDTTLAFPQERPVLKRLGELGARFLLEKLRQGSVIGIGWGTALHELVQAVSRLVVQPPYPGVRVVQLIGAVGSGNPFIDGPELARALAGSLNAGYSYLHGPLVMQSEESLQELLQVPQIRESLDVARRCDIAFVGIGSPDPRVSSLLRASYMDEQQLEDVRRLGAVGDVLARHFDIEGNLLGIEVDRRVLGVSPVELKQIPCVIGIAEGTLKSQAILGALRGGHVNGLITDSKTAEEVLRLHHKAN